MPASETERHRELKRLALTWAQLHGYRIAACEVSAPALGSRLDVAAYRPGRRSAADTTVIFECKQSRADFLKDSRCRDQIAARLAKLHERRSLYEEFLHRRVPSLRNGDALFPEFETCRYEKAGYEPYDKLLQELRTLSARLHQQTKFSDLYRWKAANLHYVVAHESIVKPHELPYGWGLLLAETDTLAVAVEPTWQDASEQARFALLQCIAIAGTRAVHREMGITFSAPRTQLSLST
jgi:hypothetical protein